MSNPINIVQQLPKVDFDGEIMKAVMSIGVNVDKEELINLLKRDRPMHYKKTALRGGIMVVRVTECPACHEEILCKRYKYPRFCTHCGQAIDWEEQE